MRSLVIVMALMLATEAKRCEKPEFPPEPIPIPTATPEPTAEPTPEPTATPTPEPTATPTPEPEPTPEPTPEPCVPTEYWTVSGFAEPDGTLRRFASVKLACRALVDHDARRGHCMERWIQGKRWCQDPGRGWLEAETCRFWNAPGGRVLHEPEDGALGLHKKGEPCPEPPPPTPTPTPLPPSPTPPPGPPSPTCTEGPPTGITIGAVCAGASPNCGLEGPTKRPILDARKRARVRFDASYYRGSPRRKVHDKIPDPANPDGPGIPNPCYPGPITAWHQDWNSQCGDETCHVDCSAPFAGGHVLRCGHFGHAGRFTFTASGQGFSGQKVVTVR